MITYEWTFPNFTVQDVGDLKDVVVTIFWELTASDGERHARVYGGCNLHAPDADAFVHLASLSKEWAINAVSAKEDIAKLQEGLAAELNAAKAPAAKMIFPPFGVQ